MERLQEIGPIDDLFEWLESFASEMVSACVRAGGEPPPAWEKIAALVNEYESGRTSFDSLYCYVAASHALHAAGEHLRSIGDEEWAREVHSMGQMFLQYATSDIGKLLNSSMQRAAQEIIASGAVADGGNSVH